MAELYFSSTHSIGSAASLGRYRYRQRQMCQGKQFPECRGEIGYRWQPLWAFGTRLNLLIKWLETGNAAEEFC